MPKGGRLAALERENRQLRALVTQLLGGGAGPAKKGPPSSSRRPPRKSAHRRRSTPRTRNRRAEAYSAARSLGATRGAARHVYSVGALSRPPLVPTYERIVHFQSFRYLNVVWVTIHCVPVDPSQPESTVHQQWWIGSDHPLTWQELSAAVSDRIAENQSRYERCFVLGFAPSFIQREVFQQP